jgi:hypothetical protein
MLVLVQISNEPSLQNAKGPLDFWSSKKKIVLHSAQMCYNFRQHAENIINSVMLSESYSRVLTVLVNRWSACWGFLKSAESLRSAAAALCKRMPSIVCLFSCTNGLYKISSVCTVARGPLRSVVCRTAEPIACALHACTSTFVCAVRWGLVTHERKFCKHITTAWVWLQGMMRTSRRVGKDKILPAVIYPLRNLLIYISSTVFFF